MFTICRIQFDDDKTEMEVVIKSNTEIEKNDDAIFFYGYSPIRLQTAAETGELLEGEWRVLEILEVANSI